MQFKFSQQLFQEFLDFKSNYPDFIKSSSNVNIVNQIPVFVFHTIEPNLFEDQLTYLANNNYRTLSIEECYDIITGNIPYIKNAILLTCDDGRFSFWQYAYPLLKKYKMKMTLFVIPGIVNVSKEYRKNLDDVWNSKFSSEELKNNNIDDKKYCNWQELKTMYDSKLVDIESHTLMHKVVFTSKSITGFIDTSTHDSVLTNYRDLNEIGDEFNREKYFGLPIYDHEPLLKGNPNYSVGNEIVKTCKRNRILSKNSFEHFQDEIQNLSLEKNILKSKEEVESEILSDLTLSRNIIKNKIHKDAGDHLCLPWTIGTLSTVEIAKEAGYKTIFWGVLENKKENRISDNPYYNCRIKNDFIFRLPGKNRHSLVKIYYNKILRRLRGEAIY